MSPPPTFNFKMVSFTKVQNGESSGNLVAKTYILPVGKALKIL
uniref:Uncharacterized protein n=1 Tax=Anguilla anguilla TaxID=7936 RepID=A0A0E9UD85_ANGAN